MAKLCFYSMRSKNHYCDDIEKCHRFPFLVEAIPEHCRNKVNEFLIPFGFTNEVFFAFLEIDEDFAIQLILYGLEKVGIENNYKTFENYGTIFVANFDSDLYSPARNSSELVNLGRKLLSDYYDSIHPN